MLRDVIIESLAHRCNISTTIFPSVTVPPILRNLSEESLEKRKKEKKKGKDLAFKLVFRSNHRSPRIPEPTRSLSADAIRLHLGISPRKLRDANYRTALVTAELGASNGARQLARWIPRRSWPEHDTATGTARRSRVRGGGGRGGRE